MGETRFKYYTQEWCEEVQKRLNSDREHLAAARNLTGTFCFRVYDCPDGTDRIAYWDFDQGRLANITLESRPAPWKEMRELPFDKTKVRARTSAPFFKLLALNKREVSILKLLTDPNYKIEGPKVEAMKYMKGLNSWNRVCFEIPTEE
ncbi:MAG: hypothetical protein IBX68_10190 [Dehalococcoidia bacterium]|nr:hypothetical protein [Dehalococcoidia bacterium]